MHRIFKALKALTLIIKNPWLLNRVLNDPDIWETYVAEKYGTTLGLPVITFNTLFGSPYDENLEIFTFLDGGSLATDVVLLKSLAKRFDKCKYFEIGTWRGESAVNVSQVAEICYTLNLTDEELRKVGVTDNIIAQQGFFSKDLPGIIHLKGNSANFNFSSFKEKFDLVFIDGDHHYDLVKNDTVKAVKHLIHENSIVVWHDYAVEPGKIRHEVLAGILDGLPPELHPFLYYVAHTKSAILIKEKLPVLANPDLTKPQGFFNVSLSYKEIDNEPK